MMKKKKEIELNSDYYPENENNLLIEDNESSENDQKKEVDTNLTQGHLEILLRGSNKTNRYVLYVTNLSFETTKEELKSHFSKVGEVRAIRIPKSRKGNFAFVEMKDIIALQKALMLHNSMLNGKSIKIQISEGGKKKSANKKKYYKTKKS